MLNKPLRLVNIQMLRFLEFHCHKVYLAVQNCFVIVCLANLADRTAETQFTCTDSFIHLTDCLQLSEKFPLLDVKVILEVLDQMRRHLILKQMPAYFSSSNRRRARLKQRAKGGGGLANVFIFTDSCVQPVPSVD